jgi:tRNA1(Val) A37 N6-methylase TrmN6
VRLLQPTRGYRVAIDPVFLAASVAAMAGETILDVGGGVGAASLCLAARVPGCRIFSLEIQDELSDLARENIALNGAEGRVECLRGSIAEPLPRLAPGSFHHVMTNPPFNEAASGNASPIAGKDLANRESAVDLASWLRFAVTMLRPKGTLVMIHRADRLDELLAALHGKVGEIVVLPLWPKVDRPAKRVVVRARKAAQTPLALLPGLVLHEADGRYTPAADRILRYGGALI